MSQRRLPTLGSSLAATIVNSMVLVVALLGHDASAQDAAAAQLDFNRDIRPILSDRCFFCHGPDQEKREAGLRLDVREEALAHLEGGDVMDRIRSDDPDLVMPPPHAKLTLTDAEKQTLETWIQQGAQYDLHWAFKQLPETVTEPSVARSTWPRQTLDNFVLQGIQAAKLTPNSPAQPLQWLRRVSLDLTGLPPTENEIANFEKALNVVGDRVYESEVDRLLLSKSFGEHFAVAWLDAARYADSYGYQSDKLNTQWPYRDWVVKAYNENLPYDDFLTWQLAGDLLENPTRDQILATAFNRIHRLNNEGGAVFEEWRIENVADRVHTFGTAVLGLTMECCRCHDHKYDPISTREYYSLAAFFNSIDESGVYDRTAKVPCPSLMLPTDEQAAALQQATDQLAVAQMKYALAIQEATDRFGQWTSEADKPLNVPGLRLALGFDHPYENRLKDIYYPTESDRTKTSMPPIVTVTDCSIARLNLADAIEQATAGKPRKRKKNKSKAADNSGNFDDLPVIVRGALQLDGERGITTKGVEPFDRWTPFSVVITMRDTERSPLRCVVAHHTRGTDCGYNGWDLTIQDGHLESRMARVWPGNAISVRTVDPIPADQWQQVSATYDGSSQARGLKLFLNGQPLKTDVLRDEVKKSANVVVDHGGEFVIGQRFRDKGFSGGLIDDVRVFERELTMAEMKQLATDQPIGATLRYYLSAIDADVAAAQEKLAEARHAVVMAEEVVTEIPIMRETATARETYLLARGQYDAERSEETRVTRDTLKNIALPFPENAPRDRLGLARWVTHPNHPLTARVAVNRLWANFFTSPLMRTPENFGVQGELPTHPQLLDWLSRDFIDSDWDVKRMCKQIALSATYRQDSAGRDDRRDQDPENRLLARGPAHRLAAEQIRDLALFASGLMVDQPGGPPVSPYQPGEDLWRESNGMSPPFQQSVGKGLYRRSLYSVWKRTAPLPNMLAFDATTREVCTVKRSRTNTPLQALVLLNDPQFVEAARVLAASVLEADDDQQRVELAFLKLTSRHADTQEMDALVKLLNDERQFFGEHPEKAKALLAIGDAESSITDSSQSNTRSTDLAAMTVVCQAILNLDAAIWKR